MKNRTDLNLGEVVCLSSITYLILDLMNGYDFYFSMQTTDTYVSTLICHDAKCQAIYL